MKKIFTLFILTLLIANLQAQQWNWTVGNGGNSGRYSQADCVLGPLSNSNILWETGATYSYWPHQVFTSGEILATDRTINYNENGTTIDAYNIISGSLLWSIALPIEFPDTDWRPRACGINSSYVFASRAGNTNHSYLYALDINNGEIVWQSESLVDMSSTEGLVYANNGDLIIGNFTNITRINVLDGSTIWQTDRSSPTSGGSEVAIYQAHIYGWEATPSQGPKISVFDINTGDFLYDSRGIGGGLVQQIAPLAGPNGMVYAPRAASNDNVDTLVAFYDNGSELVEKWKIETASVPFGTHGVGPDGSFYMYSRALQILRIMDGEVVRSQNINSTVNKKGKPIFLNDIEESVAISEPGLVKIKYFDPSKNMIPMDTSIYIGAPNAVFDSPRMAIDAEGNVFLSNGYNNVFCFNYELDLIWSDVISDVAGPALSDNGHLIFPAESTVIKVYEGRGLSCVKYPVTFFIHDQYDDALADAQVTVNGDSKTTFDNGEVVFNQEEGEIDYTVIYNDIEINGTYTVTDATDQMIDVEFITTTISDLETSNNIYPNPTNGIFTIDLSAVGQSHIRITDLSGEIIMDKSYETNKKQIIDLSNQAAGIYFIKIRSKNSSKTEKIIIK